MAEAGPCLATALLYKGVLAIIALNPKPKMLVLAVFLVDLCRPKTSQRRRPL